MINTNYNFIYWSLFTRLDMTTVDPDFTVSLIL